MITCVFGLPGQGKSTYMAYLARKALTTKKGMKRYDRVYCNFNLAGCYRLSYADLGVYNFENSLILIDEMMNEADSRDFKKFDAEKKYFFSNHRHYGCDVIYFTQSWDDVDKKIRNNTQELYYIKKFLLWSIVNPIQQMLTIDENSHQIVTGYRFKNIFSARIFFRPPYYKWFDSYERKPLKPLTKEHLQLYSPMPVRKKFFKKLTLKKLKKPRFFKK